jgi:site-specific recombinase XerD
LSLKKINDRIIDILRLKLKISRQDLAKELGIDARDLSRSINKLLTDDLIIQEKAGREVYYSLKQYNNTLVQIRPEPVASEVRVPVAPANAPKGRETRAMVAIEALKQSGQEMSQKELGRIAGMRSKDFGEKMGRWIQAGIINKRLVGRENYWWYVSNIPVARSKPQIKFTNLKMLVIRITPLQELNDHLRAVGYSEKTLETYNRYIVHFYQFKSGAAKNFIICEPERLTIRDFDAFINHCQTEHHLSENALSSAFTALKVYFKFLKSRHYIVENFLQDVSIPTPTNSTPAVGLSVNEFMEMLNTTNNHRDRALLLFLMETGARVGEIVKFTLKDINWNTNQIVIHGEKPKRRYGKPQDRINNILPEVMDYLRTYIERYRGNPTPPEEQAVFLNEWHTAMKRYQIEAIIRKLRIAINTDKRIIVHSFRHASITHRYADGEDIYLISKRVGHKKVQQTLDYIIQTDLEQIKAYQQAHPEAQSGLMAEIFQRINEKETLEASQEYPLYIQEATQ